MAYMGNLPKKIRVFGLKLFDDLKEANFKSHYLEHKNILAEYDPTKYGVNPDEGLMLAIK